MPVLWDKKQRTIVNNESSEIIRTDYYPEPLRSEIHTLNDLIYRTVNNGVYRSGFSTSQDAYNEAVEAVFATLDQLEQRLANDRYLLGNQLTEADWRLFPTLVRFDAAYYGAFKCNVRRLMDYPNLWAYTRYPASPKPCIPTFTSVVITRRALCVIPLALFPRGR